VFSRTFVRICKRINSSSAIILSVIILCCLLWFSALDLHGHLAHYVLCGFAFIYKMLQPFGRPQGPLPFSSGSCVCMGWLGLDGVDEEAAGADFSLTAGVASASPAAPPSSHAKETLETVS